MAESERARITVRFHNLGPNVMMSWTVDSEIGQTLGLQRDYKWANSAVQ